MPASGAPASKATGPPSAPASPAARPATPTTAAGPAASREGTGNAPWPREATEGGRTFTVYQPQIETWDGTRLHARAAVSVESAASPLQHFGVVWFSARAEVDKVNRLVALADFRVDKVAFPSEPDQAAEYQKVLERRLPREVSRISLDRVQAALAITEAQRSAGTPQAVKNDPPRVIFSMTPALLVLVDGKPVLRQVEGTSISLQRVVNSWALILVDQKAGKHYLRAVGRWFEASTLDGPWAVAVRPPAALDAAMQTAERSQRVNLLDDPGARREGRGRAGRGPSRLRQHGAGRAHPDQGPARLRAHRGNRPPPRPELVREHRARPDGPAPLRPPVGTVVSERVPGRGSLGVRRARQAARRLRQDPGESPPGRGSGLGAGHAPGQGSPHRQQHPPDRRGEPDGDDLPGDVRRGAEVRGRSRARPFTTRRTRPSR